MQKHQPMASQAVLEQVKRLQGDLERLRSEIRSHDEWYKKFEGLMEGHDKQIGDLLGGLKTKVETRTKGEDKLSNLITNIDN